MAGSAGSGQGRRKCLLVMLVCVLLVGMTDRGDRHPARLREGHLASSPGFPDGMLVYPLGGGATVRRTAVTDSEAVGRITVANAGRYLGTRESW